MNQGIDDSGNIVHKQIRLKLTDSSAIKPVAAMESKLLQIVEMSDDESSEEDDDEEGAATAKLERKQAKELKKRL